MRRKSSAALTPRVASPVRLVSDSSGTPLLELPIPEERFQKGNRRDIGNETTSRNDNKLPSDGNDKDLALNSDDDGINCVGKSQVEVSTGDHADTEAVSGTQGAAVPSEEGDPVADKEAVVSVTDQELRLRAMEEQELEKAELLKAQSISEAKVLLDTAVKKAKEEAELEAARIIARAKAEIVVAKESAKQEMEREEAVRKATQQVERDTEEKLKRLQKVAEEDAEKIKNEEKEKILQEEKEKEKEAKNDFHEGDLYWDENDNVGGGNALASKRDVDNTEVPSEFNKPTNDIEVADSSVVMDDNKGSSTSPLSKSDRKSKIPNLKRTPSPSSPLKPTQSEETVETREKSETAVSAKKRQKSEARLRIQKAKEDFKRKQAEDEAAGNLMAFIPMDGLETEATGGDECLPDPDGGDELLPGVDDDESVASTTVDEEEFLPRKGASFPGQGSRPDTIRALREISLQREHMDQALAELQR
jgi:hypothetical protein